LLVDTGASISIIPYDVYQLLAGEDDLPLRRSSVQIEVGNGGQLNTEGCCELRFTLGDYDFTHLFFVCRDSPQPILGNEFLVHHRMVLRMADGWLEFKGHDIPLFNQHGARRRSAVFVAQTVTVPARQETEIPTYIKTSGTAMRPYMYEPAEHLYLNTGLVAPRMLFEPRDRHPRVRLFNPTNEAISIQIHRNIGEMAEVEDIRHPGVLPMEESLRGIAVHSVADAEDPAEVKNTPTVMPEHMTTLWEKTVSELPEGEQEATKLLLVAYSDIFARHDADIGRTTLIEHDVDTGDAKPVSQSARRQSPEEHAAMVDIVETLHRCGIIRPSNSQWAANIRMAKKKDGKWRMCIDYRDLNKRTVINDPYPLPRIDALLDTLGRGVYFCALDLISGYHQVPMTERAQRKSAFITPQMSPSHWEYCFMPFGLTGAPATFQRLVDAARDPVS
jgi:hypothetical protein